MSERRRRRLSPVLADEPLVGQGIKRRLRVVLISVALAIVLTNAATYLIGQTVRADADRAADERIARLEKDFAADLDRRRRERDAAMAGQDKELEQLRRDVCTLADRVSPRDKAVEVLRRRYGCTGGPAPTASRPADGRGPDGSAPGG
ncbi:hypothetical protein, partial [Micromonospora maritima]